MDSPYIGAYMKNLNDLNPKTIGIIEKIEATGNIDLTLRLAHLGFLPKEEVVVIKKTPMTGDALLVSIRGANIALTHSEASTIILMEN